LTEELSKPSELNGISKSLGIELTSFGGGKATFEVLVAEKHLNKGGVAFGGLHASLLDSAMGAALV
jgi:acyl-coenzyme A thioesterase PaaI-like protein